jgi:predicted nucleotidyltransferase
MGKEALVHDPSSPSKIEEFQLPKDVEAFLNSIKSDCASILLCGSWAKGTQRRGSDIDLCILCNSKLGQTRVLKKISQLDKRAAQGRPFLDVKVYLEDEFKMTLQSHEHFFIYYLLEGSVVLYGVDIRPLVKLNPQYIIESVKKSLEGIESAIGYIEDGMLWDRACHKLCVSLSNLFFAQCLVHNQQPLSDDRRKLFQKMFGDQYNAVHKSYEKVRWQLRLQQTPGEYRTGVKKIKDRSLHNNREAVLQSAEEIRRVGYKVYTLLTKWVEKT